MRNSVMVMMLVLALSGIAMAGEYYESEFAGYWWYWDGDPAYEVLVPSNALAYIETEWAGTNSLQVVIAEKGPHLIAGTMPGTDVNKLWNAISAPWAATAESSRTTTDSSITTDQGLRAVVKVLEGRTPNQPTGMVRTVVFTKDGRMAYLMFVGNTGDYSGDAQQYWLRAVHSFSWR